MKKNKDKRILIYKYTSFSMPVIAAVFVFSYLFGCPIKLFTGIPCPACGLTRAYVSLFKGDFAFAFYYHPLFFLLPAALFCVIFLLYTEKTKSGKKARLPVIIFSVLIVLLFIAVYIFRLFYNFIT